MEIIQLFNTDFMTFYALPLLDVITDNQTGLKQVDILMMLTPAGLLIMYRVNFVWVVFAMFSQTKLNHD